MPGRVWRNSHHRLRLKPVSQTISDAIRLTQSDTLKLQDYVARLRLVRMAQALLCSARFHDRASIHKRHFAISFSDLHPPMERKSFL